MSMIKNKNDDNSPYIYERNEVASARYSFSLFEQRVFLKVLSLINPEDPKSLNYLKFEIKDLMNDVNTVSSKAYNQIRDAARSLRKREIHIKLKNGSDFYTGVFIDAEANPRESFIKVNIHDRLKNQYINLSGEFTRMKLCYVLNLSSPNAMRLYEILNQYKTIGRRSILLDELRHMFDCVDKYPSFAEFKRRILLPSIKAVNKNTDLKVEFIQKTQQRKVHQILFIFEEQIPAEPLLKLEPNNLKFNSEIIELYDHLKDKAEQYEKRFPVDYIKANLKHAENIFNSELGTFESCLKSCLDKDRAGFNVKKIAKTKKKNIEILKDEEERTAKNKIVEEKKLNDDILNSISQKEYQKLFDEIKAKKINDSGFNMFSVEMQKTFIEAEMIELKKS